MPLGECRGRCAKHRAHMASPHAAAAEGCTAPTTPAATPTGATWSGVALRALGLVVVCTLSAAFLDVVNRSLGIARGTGPGGTAASASASCEARSGPQPCATCVAVDVRM